jgi:uncharacterized membrane protein
MTEGSVSLARHPPAPNQTGPAEQPRTTRSPVAPALVLGVGLGGFVDGIVLHQILQWHHMLTATDRYPATTVNGLETNTLADGLFHASTWVFVAVGSALLVRAWRRGRMAPPWRLHVGLLLTGWGLFNVIEGLVDHHLLRIHHVRDDVADPHWWDLGFLGFGAALLVVGLLLAGSSGLSYLDCRHRNRATTTGLAEPRRSQRPI